MTEARVLGDIGHILDRGNILINPQFDINQREWASGGNLVAVGDYAMDRWCAAIANTAPTLSGDILTIAAGDAIKQIVEDVNIPNGDYTISWEGTAQLSIDGGADQSSPHSFTVSSGTDVEIEFGPGTLQQPMLVPGDFPLPFIRRQYSYELILCQRYFLRMLGGRNGYGYRYMDSAFVNCVGQSGQFPVTMRTDPATTIAVAPTYTQCILDNIISTNEGYAMRVEVSSADQYRVYGGEFDFDAEL